MIEAHLLTVGEIKIEGNIEQILHSVLSGDTILLIPGSCQGIIVNTRGFETRGIQEPNIELWSAVRAKVFRKICGLTRQ